MLNFSIKLFVLFFIAASAGAVVYGDVNELAGESLAVYNRLKELGAQKKDATSKQTKRISEIKSQLKELSPEIVVKYNRQIEQYTAEIEQLKKKIAELQGKVDEIENSDPNSNRAEVERLSGELNELIVVESRLGKPFDEQIKQVKQISPEKNAAYKDAMARYCLIPGKDYAEVVKTSVSASIGGSIFSYKWTDAQGKQLAWSHLRLRDKSEIKPRAVKLDDIYSIISHSDGSIIYSIISHSDGSIWVWAGQFKICLVMNKKEWQGKTNIGEALKAFIDLKGLAEIKATAKEGPYK